MKKPSIFLALNLLPCLFLFSCNEHPSAPTITVTLTVEHEADGKPLLPDTLLYTNQAGYRYSISRLEYYLSNIRFERADGQESTASAMQYLNFRDTNTTTISLAGLAPGTYTALCFNLGLTPAQNRSGALPHTLEHGHMAWPDPMGGGYHFMKLEGKYAPGNDRSEAAASGFALHLGKNQHLVPVRLPGHLLLDSNHSQLRLVMNLSEWFRNPHTIDFEKDGTYSMSDDELMAKLAANGASVFKLVPGTR